MNTTSIANIAIATLELIENGLRNIIYTSDRLQEKLELHKLAVINNEQRKAEDNLKRIEAKLANESFTSRAPENVVNAEREKAEKARSLIAKLEESAAAMKL